MKPRLGTCNSRTVFVIAAALVLLPQALPASPKYRILHDFTGGGDGDGNSGVSLDQQGNLYGLSLGGGTGSCEDGCGLVFQLVPQAHGKWTQNVLYDFQPGGDGEYPSGTLAFDARGDIYGTTQYGGAHDGGTVFELKPHAGGWTETVLHSLCAAPGCGDGWLPRAGVVTDASGNLYGTAGEVAFELSPGSGRWNETVLHRFDVRKGDGALPYAGLILDASGNLYGTTGYGGNQCGSSTCGTVYELSPESGGKWKETILHRFRNSKADGAWPGAGALSMDGEGNLYGTTTNGGCCGGVVYELTPQPDGRWKETILYDFLGGAEGWLPDAGVVMDKAGNLYGTTDGGGNASGCGVLYKLAPTAKGKWKYTVLHTFGNGYDGCLPSGNLAIDSSGNLYGGTIFGGTSGNGVVFELTP